MGGKHGEGMVEEGIPIIFNNLSMPIDKEMMASMKKKYGDKKGEQVYRATENRRKAEKKKERAKGMVDRMRSKKATY